MLILAFGGDQFTAFGIHSEFESRTVEGQNFDFIDPMHHTIVFVTIEFNIEHFACMLTLHPRQNRCQGQHLTGLKCLTGTIMITVGVRQTTQKKKRPRT